MSLKQFSLAMLAPSAAPRAAGTLEPIASNVVIILIDGQVYADRGPFGATGFANSRNTVKCSTIPRHYGTGREWAYAGQGSRYGRMRDAKPAKTEIERTGTIAVLNVAHQFFRRIRPLLRK